MTGIVGALDEELKLLVDNLEEKKIQIGLRHNIYQGVLAGHQVVLTTTGIGKVRAAARTQFLIDHFPLKRLILVGVAGAINPRLQLGDVVISRRALQHDFDLSSAPQQRASRWYEADPQLVELALKAGEKLGLKQKLYSGSVLSGDQAITQLSRKTWLWQTFAGDCVEMEGAAVAMVCWMNALPFVLIRTISDLADQEFPAELGDWFYQAASCSAAIALEMLRMSSPLL
jgi:adenosylhomocysteine nucleosidase